MRATAANAPLYAANASPRAADVPPRVANALSHVVDASPQVAAVPPHAAQGLIERRVWFLPHFVSEESEKWAVGTPWRVACVQENGPACETMQVRYAVRAGAEGFEPP